MIAQHSDLTTERRTEHEQKYGSFNDFPPNWREVTEAEIATESLGRMYSPVLVEYRQMGKLEVGGPPMLAATLSFYHDGSGSAIHYDYWGKRVRWFMFGLCDQHNYTRVKSPGNGRSGLHTDRCTKCGYQNSYDTSD